MTSRALLALAVLCTAGRVSALVSDRALTARKLRQYCRACHAIGELRFVPSDRDDELWSFILTRRPPRGTRLWAERIVELLDWPSDAAPSNLEEPQWMPKGGKRAALAADTTEGVPTRRVMLATIREALATRGRAR